MPRLKINTVRQFIALLTLISPILYFPQFSFAATDATVKYKYNKLSIYGYKNFTTINGRISPSTVKKLQNIILAKNIKPASIVVYLNSPGGNLVSGIELGKIIRNNQFDTKVGTRNSKASQQQKCLSACVFAFAGGKFRYLSNGLLGVHRFHYPKPPNAHISTAVAQINSANIVNHLKEMGVNLELFKKSAITDKNEMYLLSKDEALKFNLINDGVLPPKWSLEINDLGLIYLKGWQESARQGDSKILFTCESSRSGEPEIMILHRAPKGTLISGEYKLRIDDKTYPIKNTLGDIARNNGYLIISFKLTLEHFKKIKKAAKIGFMFHLLNPVFSVGFTIPTSNKSLVTSYMQRCTYDFELKKPKKETQQATSN